MKNNLPTLSTSEDELEKQLLEETDVENIRNIIDIFNLNIQRKNIIRTSKLNELQDKVYDQINERITQNADAFSNKDLLDYFKVVQETINKTSVNSEDLVSPKIQLNQININTEPQLNKESRDRITSAISKILNTDSTVIESSAKEIIKEQEDSNE